MFNKSILVSIFAGAVGLTATMVNAAEPVNAPVQMQQTHDIYGSQLMTAEEREVYRAQMRNLTAPKDREDFRLEHHKLMQERAAAKGVALPNEMPMPAGGQGMTPGAANPNGMSGSMGGMHHHH